MSNSNPKKQEETTSTKNFATWVPLRSILNRGWKKKWEPVQQLQGESKGSWEMEHIVTSNTELAVWGSEACHENEGFGFLGSIQSKKSSLQRMSQGTSGKNVASPCLL